MWHETDLALYRALPPQPVDIHDAVIPLDVADAFGLVMTGCLIERRGPYSRAALRANPANGGFAWRKFEIVIQAGQPDQSDGETGSSFMVVNDFGAIVVANWLLSCLWPQDGRQLGLPYVRRMANGVVVEGCLGDQERGVLIANSIGVSRDSYALARAANYDMLLSAGIDASSPYHALASVVVSASAGRLIRQTDDTQLVRIGRALERRQTRRDESSEE